MRNILYAALGVFLLTAISVPARAAGDVAETPSPARLPLALTHPVRSVYSDGERTLSFTGLGSDRGPMAVVIEYVGPGDVYRRLVVSTHRFGDYEASLKTFFSNLDTEFLKDVRLASHSVIEQLTSTPNDGSPRLREKAQLALVELGSFHAAGEASAKQGRQALGTPDCWKIAEWARPLSQCIVYGLSGPFGTLPCAVALANATNIPLDDVQGCINSILKLICEMNGPNWQFFAADPNVPGSHWDCFECFGETCHVVASSEVSSGGGVPDRNPENQETGSSPGFGFVDWIPGGTVSVCSEIVLDDGRIIKHCD